MEEHRSGFGIVLSSNTNFIVHWSGSSAASFGVLTIFLVTAVGGGHRE